MNTGLSKELIVSQPESNYYSVYEIKLNLDKYLCFLRRICQTYRIEEEKKPMNTPHGKLFLDFKLKYLPEGFGEQHCKTKEGIYVSFMGFPSFFSHLPLLGNEPTVIGSRSNLYDLKSFLERDCTQSPTRDYEIDDYFSAVSFRYQYKGSYDIYYDSRRCYYRSLPQIISSLSEPLASADLENLKKEARDNQAAASYLKLEKHFKR